MTPDVETKYAWNGDVSLAYQVVGHGPIDLLYLQGYGSQVDVNWEGPALSRFLRGLASFSRLIVTDRRGWGCSDRFSPFDVTPLESMTDDLLCVLDTAGSKRAVICGTSECGINASLFAATYPQRTRGLILIDAIAAYDEKIASGSRTTEEEWHEHDRLLAATFGTPEWTAHWKDRQEAAWFTRWQRATNAPGGLVAEFRRNYLTDIRPIYPTIHVPALVLATTSDDPMELAANGRYLADSIPGARLVQHDFVERPWLHWYHRGPAILAEIERFIHSLGEEQRALERVLATILFTDIVDSTATAARLGDAGWRDVVERHHALARAMLDRYDGREVDTAGDGFFATFDGPGRAIRAAQAIVGTVPSLGIEVRAGIHTGECELVDGKPGGLAVNVGARIASLAGPSEVLVSDTVRNLVAGSGIGFEDRGPHTLKGVPDEWRVWSVVDESGRAD